MLEPSDCEERPSTDWPVCSRHDDNGCIGIRVGTSPYCLAHLEHQNPEEFRAFFASLGPGASLDLRGTQLSSELLKRVLARLRTDETQHPTVGDANFDRAQFSGPAGFQEAQFSEPATFEGAQFSGPADFDGAQFSKDAWFLSAQFREDAWFGGAQFNGPARFNGAQFSGPATFDGAQFGNDAWFQEAYFSKDAWFQEAYFSKGAGFGGAQFNGPAGFGKVQFSEGAWFQEAQFSKGAGFGGAQFNGDVAFDEAQFSGDAWFGAMTGFGGAQFSKGAGFGGAQFNGSARFDTAQFIATSRLGPLRADLLALDGASFGASVAIDVAARRLSIVETRFEREAVLSVRYADVLLDRAAFAKPSSLAFAENPFFSSPTPTNEQSASQQSQPQPQGPLPVQGPILDEAPLKQAGLSPRPRLLSLRRVDTANLVVADANLTWCLFRGALNLDKVRIEGPKYFATTPKGWQWTHRRTLAEEQQWRHTRHPKQGWTPPSREALTWVAERSGQQVQQADPDHTAPLYRALRKAEEDAKYEPGAADFYYGEMEMRRHARGTPWIEKRLLWAYWLVAGYGLRASRALLALLVVLIAATATLAAVGFPAPTRPANAPITGTITGGPTVQHLRLDPPPAPPPTPTRSFVARCGTAWWIALEAAVFRSPDQTLTPAGRHVQTVVRFFGPVLLGLALLSVRGRVKR